MKKYLLSCFIVVGLFLASCNSKDGSSSPVKKETLPDQFIIVLGIAQDAGYPQAGCEKECCAAYWQGKETKKHVTCLAVVDRIKNKYWLLEATPDMGGQMHSVRSYLDDSAAALPAGIFITHAHIGHYTGLMQLGREVIGAKAVPVFAMPRLDSFLRNNGPWNQLVKLENIKLISLQADSAVSLDGSFTITPVQVPHRDEYSETVGFIIESEKKKILFIPDIDKWEKWNKNFGDEIRGVNLAIIDGTFYANGELPGRDMSEVPHPFVEESMKKFSVLPSPERSKIIFIHFNHTNPLLKKSSPEKEQVKRSGFGVAEEGMVIEL